MAWQEKIPYGAHVIILFTLAFAALILVILITFSSPFISSINFLRLPSASGDTTFGSFGWCSPDFCLPNQVAYEFGTQVNKALTGGMMLWAISIIFTFFTVLAILPLLFVHESKALRTVGNRIFFVYTMGLATLLVLVAWLYSIYGWSIAHRAFEVADVEVKLGSAIWMGLVAALCMLIIFIIRWPAAAWDGKTTRANGGTGARGVPQIPNNGYYHYKRTTREVVPRY
ncbi:hypothetical protein I317_04961 [Kwoniella heveanensis CBS 569]|uniref:Pali-domain-containing protein n=1 Tax=Kwoniella heveanensis BCC8398 TaxID=1296120 RepID=A0A1B9GWX5_9TREE|nr:hypothetical protein I316_02997 [Kwoniella heveanensis BCC8398]OCF41215.1 hypothetical protein I317_04961 [Kwoniella heveanensis CBS 569]